MNVLNRPLSTCEISTLASDLAQNARQKSKSANSSYLAKVVEQKVLPRLLADQGNIKQLKLENITHLPLQISAQEISAFSVLLLTASYAECRDYALRLCHAGCSINEIYYSLAVDAARNLEYLWEADACTFGTTTIAIGHLQAILRELNPLFHTQADLHYQAKGHAFAFAMPNSQHTVGVFLLTENLIQHGWNVLAAHKTSKIEILRTVKDTFFHFAAISISSIQHWDELEKMIPLIRKVSLNPHLHVMVGGALFTAYPKLLEQSSADSCTSDLETAIKTAASLVK